VAEKSLQPAPPQHRLSAASASAPDSVTDVIPTITVTPPSARLRATSAAPAASAANRSASERPARARVGPPGEAPDAARSYYNNIGLLAEASNARKAHERLLAAGVAAFTQELESAKGKRTRVRAGPYDSASDAQAAAEKIRALALEAVVFRQ
jgi:cell division septation protein DedD